MTNELTQWYLKDYLNNKQDDSKSNSVEKRYSDL